MEQDPKVDIPAWLEESPTRITDLPVQSNIQVLPFEKLTWENFERLCLRLIRKEADVENCRLYGKGGNKQEGIDIYAILHNSEKYHVYQCKREKTFSPAKIKKAVNEFLAGTWAKKTSAFILCTQESLKPKKLSDEIIAQTEELHQTGISFIPWDSEELSIKLKDHPEIIADFFNEHFVKDFCVKVQIENLNDKIEESKCIEEYKKWIADRTSYFQLPGLREKFSIETDWIPREVKILQNHSKPFTVELIPELEFLKSSILIGDSDVDKQTIINRLANYLVNAGAKILLIYLPDVLNLTQNGKTFNEAVLEVSIDGLSSDKKLLLSALNNPDYLLADGLDKCGIDRTIFAKKISSWVEGHSNTKVILTSQSGHEVEIPSNWVRLEVQPLRKEHIQEFTINALNKLLIESSKLDKKLTLIKETTFLETDLNLIGFIISLAGSDIDISKMNRAEIYKSVIYNANHYQQQPRESISTIKKILEIIAWKLIDANRFFLEEKLLEELIKELRLMGYSLSEAERAAENGIEFWEDKCILNRSNSRVDFVHSSICAYAAGQYAIKLSDADFQSWIKEAIQNTEWKESVSFACGLGAGEKVIRHLLSLDELNLVTLCIAASAITESKELSSDLLENIVNKIYCLLESDSPLIIIKATDALLSIVPKAHQIIANATKTPLTNISLWNRLAVMKITLACDEENVDLDILLDLIKEVLSSITRPSLLTSENPRVISLIPLFLGNKWEYWEAKNQIILDGCKLLLKKRKEINTVDSILDLFTGDSLDEITKISIGNALPPIFREMLDDTTSLENRSAWLPPFLRYLDIVINPKLQEFSSPQYWNKQIRELKRVERDKSSDKAFLASVLRVVEQTDKNSFVEYPVTSLSSLGTLHSGMGWEEISMEEWHTFDQIDTEACDAVLKCMIAVLGINQKKLRLEVLQEWKHVNDFFVSKLPPIKKILQNSTITSEHFRVSKYIQDEIILSSMSYRIPLVPINYNWKLIEDIKICPEILSRALKYPSQGIYCSAVLLIMNGVGGRESLDLAKKIVGEDKWNTFLKS
jgi:hypothetical protein